MGGEEGTSNGDTTGDGVRCFKSKTMNNGFTGIRIGNDSGDGGSGPSEGLRTYKRRKHTRSSSESKGQEDGRVSVEAASKLAHETTKEPTDYVPENRAPLDGSNVVSQKECRHFVLDRIYQSLGGDGGGIQGCIQDVLMTTIKESEAGDKNTNKWSSQSGWRRNGIHYAARENMDVTSNESSDNSHRPVTKMCQHAFLNIIQSEKFSSLCKLLSDNFLEMKPDNLLCFSRVNARMKDGIYEQEPSLFHEDILRVWRKLENIGDELISLAKSLSDVSSISYEQQLYSQESYFHGKPAQIEAYGAYSVSTCTRCRGRADGRNCLVCDSCEDMYHVTCIKPAVTEIPSKSWYCARCAAGGVGSPHENCKVCERLNASRNLCTQASDKKGSPRIGNGFSEFEETTNWKFFHQAQPEAGEKTIRFCNVCHSKLKNGEKVKICDHVHCPFKYYHVRCLTKNLLTSYDPQWYCPSCLCRACLVDTDDTQIVLCDCCDHAYHMYCMNPPRTSVPIGKWFCRQCDAKIKEIGRVKRAYKRNEKASRLKKKAEEDKRASENLENKLDEKCEQGMEILLTAAALL